MKEKLQIYHGCGCVEGTPTTYDEPEPMYVPGTINPETPEPKPKQPPEPLPKPDDDGLYPPGVK